MMRNFVKYGLPLALIGAGLVTGCAAGAERGDLEDSLGSTNEPLCRTGAYWANGTIPVCWSATAQAHPSFAARSVQTRADVEGTWKRFANVNFTGWGACPSNTAGMVEISLQNGVRPSAGGIGFQSAGLKMKLDPTRSDFQAVAIHEFGHVLGYRHEFVRSDNPNTSCPLQNGESKDASCDTEGTPFDPDSIMASTGYCQNNPSLSSSDVLGAQVGYGTPFGYVSGQISQDFDGDGKADQVLFRGTNWYVRPRSGGADIVTPFGVSTDRYVPGDYDGDGKTDYAVYRPSEGKWYVKRSSGGADMVMQFGVASDVQVPADYDGDGKTDFGIYRPSEGKWYVRTQAGGADIVTTFGVSSDIAIPGDWDGDGKADRAVFRPSNGTWFAKRSSGGADMVVQFGTASDIALPGDYDGDGKLDPAVFRPSTATWYVRPSAGGGDITVAFGAVTDRFLVADYNNDGKDDYAVYRPTTEKWHIRYSGTTTVIENVFGVVSDSYPNSR